MQEILIAPELQNFGHRPELRRPPPPKIRSSPELQGLRPPPPLAEIERAIEENERSLPGIRVIW
jgi:hypothetical protein